MKKAPILVCLQLLHKTTPRTQPFSPTLGTTTTIMADFPGKQQQSIATNLLNKTRAERFPPVHQLFHSKSSGDTPFLERVLSSLKPASLLSKRKSDDSLLPLSTASAEEVPHDEGWDEDELQPKQQHKKPKLMPAANWISDTQSKCLFVPVV